MTLPSLRPTRRLKSTLWSVLFALGLTPSWAFANPVPRDGDMALIDWSGATALGEWDTASESVHLVDAAGSRNLLVAAWERPAPTRLRARITSATGADVALLFRASAKPQARGPMKLFGYALSVDVNSGRLDFLRFDGVRIDDPGVAVRSDGLKAATSIDVVLLMSGPIFSVIVYDAISGEQLASLAWSDATYASGAPGLYSHRRTPPEVGVRLEAGVGDLPPAPRRDLSADWLVRVGDGVTLPDGIDARLRKLTSPFPGERVYIGDEATVAALREVGVDHIAQPHIPYRFRDRDFDKRHNKTIKATRRGVTFVDGLKDPSLVAAHLKAYSERFPELTKLRSIGRSHEGRDIWALTLSRSPDDLSKPALLLCAAHHANEASTPEFVLDAIRYLLENRRKREVRRWLKDFRIVAVPMVNPDGSHAFWHVGEHLGRTNRRPSEEANQLGLSDFGVDLNRNYPFGWANVEDRFNSNEQASRFYRGPSPGSEPEVQAMMRLAAEERFFGMISYHGAATKILVPYTVDGAKEPVRSIAWAVAEDVVAALPHKFRGRPYEAVRNLYPVGGVDQDWYFHEHGTVALLLEVPATIPTRRRPLEEMLEHSRPAWQTLLRRFAAGPSLTLTVQDVDGSPVAAQVDIEELGLAAGERWSTHPRTGRAHLFLPEDGTYTVVVDTGDGRVSQRVRVGRGAPTDAVVRLSVEAQ